MTTWLKQSTATDVEIGAFVDETDGKTPETGLTIAQADCQLIKNGGAAAQKNDATSATHLVGGHYKVPLNATDTGTLGRLRLVVNETGALPMWRDFMVVPANVWDSFFGADRLQVHADEITAGLITAATIATGAFDADALATDAVTEIQSGLATATALQTVDDLVDDLESRLTAARAGYLDNLSGGAVALASAVQTVDDLVDELESRLTAARAGYLDNLSGGAVALASALQTVDDLVDDLESRLTAARAGYLDNLSAGAAALQSSVDDLEGRLTAARAGYLENLRGGAVALASAATTIIAYVDELESRLTAARAGYLDNLSGGAPATAAQVNAEVLDVLTTDTFAEPAGVPAATSSLKDKIGWLFTLARNKRLTTSSADKVRNDADSADVGTATLDDNGTTFTRGEYS